MADRSIVICAFGPADVTRGAVHRARRLAGRGGRVVVFAAHRGAIAAVRSMPRAAAERITEHGAAGARAALAALSGPVLYVHDDVLVSSAALHALVAAHNGGVTVPWSNDLGTDHFAGPLPLVRRGEGHLRAEVRSLQLPAGEASSYRPSCVYAEVATLRELIGSHITAATTIVEDALERATVAPGAVVTHDTSCLDQLLPPQGPEGRPLLVASLIVKDESVMLPACLESLQGLVDRIEICDTGSSDDSIAIAESFGAHVIERQWRNDFAWARNQALEASRDAWFVLVLDADERVRCDDPDLVRRRLATVAGETRAFRVPIENIEDVAPGRTAVSTMTGSRIFSPDELHYVGALHEQPSPLNPDMAVTWTLLDGLTLEHHGYRLDVFTEKNKADRNIAISRVSYEDDPSPVTALNYARSLLTAGTDPDLQRRLLTEALADDSYFSNAGRASVLTRLAEVHARMGDHAEALRRASEALELVPADDMALTAHGRAARALGRHDLVVAAAERRRTAPSVRPTYASQVAWAASRSREVEGLLAVGRIDEAFAALEEILRTEPDGFDGWSALADALFAVDSNGALNLLLQLSLVGGASGCFGAISERCNPELTAECVVAYLQAGGREAPVVEMGFAAAMVSGRWDIYEAIAPASVLLPRDVVERITARASERGAPNPTALAEALDEAAAAV